MSSISNYMQAPPNNFSTTLSGSISSSDLTVPLNSVSGLPTEGVGVIFAKDTDGKPVASSIEFIHWTNISGNNLTLTDSDDRGIAGSASGAQAHNSGDTFEVWVHSQYYSGPRTAFLTEHTQGGAHTTDVISEKTADAGVTVDGILLKDNLDTSGIVDKTSAQTITGAKTVTTPILFGNGTQKGAYGHAGPELPALVVRDTSAHNKQLAVHIDFPIPFAAGGTVTVTISNVKIYKQGSNIDYAGGLSSVTENVTNVDDQTIGFVVYWRDNTNFAAGEVLHLSFNWSATRS